MKKDKEKQGFIGVSIPKDLETWVKQTAENENRPVSRQVVEFIKEAREIREAKSEV